MIATLFDFGHHLNFESSFVEIFSHANLMNLLWSVPAAKSAVEGMIDRRQEKSLSQSCIIIGHKFMR